MKFASIRRSRSITALTVLLLFAATGLGQDRGFSNERSMRHYTRDRVYDVQHLKLKLSFDHLDGKVMGTAIMTFTPINDGLSQLVLDAVDLSIAAVVLEAPVQIESSTRPGNRQLNWSLKDNQLIIDLDKAYNSGEQISVSVAYAAQPEMGLYFVRPDEGYPDKPWQIWSQGEMEESRHWFPCYDAPNDRMTTEMIVTVPEGMMAVSNGELISEQANATDGTVTYHWRESVPHVTYLVSLVVGEFVEVRDEWEGIPLLYYMDARHADMAERVYGRTADMLEFYSTVTGMKYPYEKYAQTTIADFTWGGMENISATTLNERVFHDERAALDYSPDGLIAHELAHQWFGDLLTTKNWNHIWLNEAFATYFDALFVEHAKGEREFLLELALNRGAYLREDKLYRRPIVTGLYEDPGQMFDRHSYQKGALVLHMVRYMLGDDLWWKAIRHYVTTHAGETVETDDLKQAIEDATGQSLEWFFDEWVYGGGHPVYEVSWKWERWKSAVALTVKQVQPVDRVTPLFRMPVEIELAGDFGTRRETILVDKVEETFLLPLDGKPSMVSFDPDDWILKELRFEKSKQALLLQLQASNDVGRRRAAEWLADYDDRKIVHALGEALREDPFRGVRAKAAQSLGKIGTEAARGELLSGLEDAHSSVRRAAISALGNYEDDAGTVAALVKVFRKDSSYYAQAAAVAALARVETEQAYDIAVEALELDSYRQVILDSAMTAFVTLKDPRGIDYALSWSAYGQPDYARVAAIRALAKLAPQAPKRRTEIRKYLVSLLEDPHFRARNAATKALGDLGDQKAIPALEARRERELDFGSSDVAREAIEKIREHDGED